ncbi:MAG: OsmC family protein [candidate division Zixibacteria bacterium]|nr:OsmC family protein [candidate division Zixibacteria bacterium]
MADGQFTISMEQLNDFEFKVKFDDGKELLMDEPEPIGSGNGPNPARLISASIGYCLSASLFFSLQKARVDSKILKTTVTTQIGRNDKGRLRIAGSKVIINADLDQDESSAKKISKSLELFEDFCIATQSIRDGIDVDVEVIDQNGKKIHG